MLDNEQTEKVNILENLLNSIQSKTKAISGQTKFLKAFNRKLEILMMCFRAYSIDEENLIENGERNIENLKNSKENTKNIEITSYKETQKISKIKKSISSDEIIDDIKRLKRDTDLTLTLEKIFINNPVNKSLAVSILELIGSRISITLDELVKSIKLSKYKVIDVLNTLIKEKIVVKNFEKGFVYRISKDFINSQQ